MFLTGAEEGWPESEQAALARRILPEYMRLGPERFVANAGVEMRVVRAGDQAIPVVWRNCESWGGTPDVSSAWSHYVRYPLDEVARNGKGVGALLRRCLVYAGVPVLAASRIDEAVLVNNWLISTNPAPSLDRGELERLTGELCKMFPGRAILFRTVNPLLHRELAERLVACGYQFVAGRVVYVLDPKSREYQRSENAREDRKMLYDGGYEIVAQEELTAADMPRIAELHRMLYIEKHSRLNPKYTELFFETASRNRFFEYQGLRKEGRIEGYVAWYEFDGLLVGSLVGYDTRLAKSSGLYRRCVALMMEEARRRGIRLHLSAGAGAFKHHRGARPCVEYDAVFCRHLPVQRRAGWDLLKTAGVLQHRKVRRGW